MKEFMPIVLDVLTLLVILGYLRSGWKQGFVRMLLSFVGTVLLLIGSYAGSGALAKPAAQAMRGFLIERANEQLAKSAGAGISELITGLVGILPDELQQSLFGFSVDPAAMSAAEVLTDTTLLPLVEWFLSCLLFLLLFGIGSGLLHALIRKIRLDGVFLVGFVNSASGALVGVVKGVLVMMVVTLIVGLILSFTGGGEWLNPDVVRYSTLFRFFYVRNPFLSNIL